MKTTKMITTRSIPTTKCVGCARESVFTRESISRRNVKTRFFIEIVGEGDDLMDCWVNANLSIPDQIPDPEYAIYIVEEEMELGDRVRFTKVIVKELQDNGARKSVPVVKDLEGEGLLAGETVVREVDYSSGKGIMGESIPVYKVAVSMKRMVKVPLDNLQKVSLSVEDAVSKIVKDWVANKRTFTAWEVTKEIQKSNLGVTVNHQDVRDLVWGYMYEDTQLDATYSYEIRTYGNAAALTYFPQ
jgi:hypothetical protein